VSDCVRRFSEECGRLEGFQCFVDTNSAIGGFGAKVLEEIVDEYSKRPLVVLRRWALPPCRLHLRHWHRAARSATRMPYLGVQLRHGDLRYGRLAARWDQQER
jgi:hypothetical protein